MTIFYGDENAGIADTSAWGHAFQLGPRDSSYSQFIAGLESETTYYFTAIAENTAGLVWAQPVLSFTTPEATPESIVINELHVDPNIKVEPVEYVELYNAGDLATDLSGWSLAGAVEYTLPDGTVVEPGGYLVVSQDPAAVQAKYGVASLGPFAGRLRNEGDRVVLRDRLAQIQDEVAYQLGFPWPTVGDPPGFTMELIHPALDNDLGGSWRSSNGATPGRVNSVYSTNAAPQTRQVNHSPKTPESGEDVVITAKITDPDGVGSVQLAYQIVEPGDYIELTDPRYQTEWTAIDMADNGLAGDEAAGDDVFSVVLPGSLQTHRRLIRYRITVSDATGISVTVPYADDPTPNFAYFVYDGVPDWTGSARPGVEPDVTYSSDLLNQLPTYQLLTTRTAHEDCAVHSGFLTGQWLRRQRIPVAGCVCLRRRSLRPHPLSGPRRRVALFDGQEHVEVRLQPRPRLSGSRRLWPEVRHDVGQAQFLGNHPAR